MKSRPILFSGPMVRALLDGSKTQTRRAVKLPPESALGTWEATTIGGPNGGHTAYGQTIPEQGTIWHTRSGKTLACPHGQPGDTLWVRETWCCKWDNELGFLDEYWYRASTPDVDHVDGESKSPWKPSIHMPRAASRITLEIIGVRVERLQNISLEDAKAEGAWGPDESIVGHVAEHFGIDVLAVNPIKAYQMLWESINAPGSWGLNPWVWVLEFRTVKP